MLHVSGYGGGGPASDRPGFGTLAEAMSGFAHVTGQPDGPPTLPPFFLADGIAAQSATFAVMMALYHRDLHGGHGPAGRREPRGAAGPPHRDVDPGLQPARDRPGPHREPARRQCAAQRLPHGGRPLGRPLERVAQHRDAPLPGRRPADLAEDEDYVDPIRRQAHGDEIDDIVARWIGARALDEVMRVFEQADVAAAPVYDAEQLLADEHLRARGSFVQVDDPDLGRMTVQAPVARLSETPGRVDHLGRGVGADNDAVYRGLLGLDADAPRGRCGTPGPSEPSSKEPHARTTSPTFGAGDAGEQRAHVREGGVLRRRPRVPRPRGCLRPLGQGGCPRHRRGRPDRAGLGKTVRAVRINGIDTPWCHGDIIEVVTGARDALDVVIVPKVRRARDVWWVDVLLTQLETQLRLPRPIGLEVLIEEAEGLANALDIARASERLEALIFGAGDLSASLHARVDGNFDPVVPVPRRLLALRPRAGADGGPGRHGRCRRRALSRLPGPRGLPALGAAGERARLRRQVGHPPEPGPDRQRGVLADGRGGGGGPRGHGDLPGGGGRRCRCHRARREAGRRRAHAAGRQHAAQGRAGPGAGGDPRADRAGRRAPPRWPGGAARSPR